MRLILTLFISFNLFVIIQLKGANDTLRIVRLEGTPYERGLKYGAELKPEINAMINDWLKHVEKSFKKPADSVINDFIETTGLYNAVEKIHQNCLMN